MTGVEVELIGGPFDGRVMLLVADLPEWLEVPVPVGAPSVDPVDPVDPAFSRVSYHRCVISDVTHRWRYVLGVHERCRTWPVAL